MTQKTDKPVSNDPAKAPAAAPAVEPQATPKVDLDGNTIEPVTAATPTTEPAAKPNLATEIGNLATLLTAGVTATAVAKESGTPASTPAPASASASAPDDLKLDYAKALESPEAFEQVLAKRDQALLARVAAGQTDLQGKITEAVLTESQRVIAKTVQEQATETSNNK